MAIYQNKLITFKLNCSFQLQGELQNEWITVKLNGLPNWTGLIVNWMAYHQSEWQFTKTSLGLLQTTLCLKRTETTPFQRRCKCWLPLTSGSFLQVIGDTFLGFDKSTVSRVVRRVTQALSANVGDFVKFPSTRAERDEIKQGLFRVGGFPCAIGCIDGTHVRITAPHENEPDFVNRKGYHSINVQAICNHRGKQIRPLLNLGFCLHQGFLSCEQLARSLLYSAIKSGIRKRKRNHGNGNVLTLWLEWEIVKF